MQRQTIQREIVLQAVQVLCHATADEIYRHVIVSHPAISKATVYRNLNVLADNGCIGRIDATTGADYYDCTTTQHYHLQCDQCGKVFDVPCTYLRELNKIPTDAGVLITGHTVLFRGICATCNSKKKGK